MSRLTPGMVEVVDPPAGQWDLFLLCVRLWVCLLSVCFQVCPIPGLWWGLWYWFFCRVCSLQIEQPFFGHFQVFWLVPCGGDPRLSLSIRWEVGPKPYAVCLMDWDTNINCAWWNQHTASAWDAFCSFHARVTLRKPTTRAVLYTYQCTVI